MRAMWTSGQENYPPTRYGPSAEMAVEIASITFNRRWEPRGPGAAAQSALTSPNGDQVGMSHGDADVPPFQTRTDPLRSRLLAETFGFTAPQYAIRSDRSE